MLDDRGWKVKEEEEEEEVEEALDGRWKGDLGESNGGGREVFILFIHSFIRPHHCHFHNFFAHTKKMVGLKVAWMMGIS
ncbi:MAG UNVERIFIED_CONTAM: hypothetical protein LVR29_11000 [Microcystis novacekii LVE1205-3]